jgi:DNA polymerase III delta subunit
MNTVCVIEGNLKERKGFLEKLKESLANYELFVFDQNNTYDYVSQLVTEISCFGERRLFIIKELPQLKTVKKEKDTTDRAKILNQFKKLFPVIPAGNVLLFDNVGISAVSFLKEVKKYGKVYNFEQKIPKLSAGETSAKKIIFNYFKNRKISINDDSIILIMDSLNIMGKDVDIDKLELLLIKLYNYVYGKTNITTDDVYAVCSTSPEFVVWTLYNILDGDDKTKYGKAFGLVMDFLNSTRYFSHEATMLIQGMLWRYGLILLIKNAINNKVPIQEIISNISNLKKLKSEGKAQKVRMSPNEDKPEYSLKMINSVIEKRYRKPVISCYTFDELLMIYCVISKSLVKIRSGCTKAEIITFLQMILLTICGELKANTIRDGILDHKKMIGQIL